MTRRLGRWLPSLLLIAAGLVGCQAGRPVASQAPPLTMPPSASGIPERTPTNLPGAAVTPDPDSELAVGTLKDLATLDSYRLSTEVVWEPAGRERREVSLQMASRAREYASGVYRDHARHWRLTVAENGRHAETVEFVTFAERTWQKEDGAYEPAAVAPGALLEQMGWVASPWQVLRQDATGRFVGAELVDGHACGRYRFDLGAFVGEDDLGFALTDGEAEVWASVHYDVVVRVTVHAQGTDEAGQRGTLMAEARVTDMDAPFDIELPEALTSETDAPPLRATPTP